MKMHEIKTRLLERGYTLEDASEFISTESRKKIPASTVKSALQRWSEKPAQETPRGKKTMLALIGVSLLIGEPCSAHVRTVWHEVKTRQHKKAA